MQLGTLTVLTLGTALLSAAACTNVIKTAAVSRQQNVLIESASDMVPQTVPYDKASLILMGQSYPVTVIPKSTDNSLDLDLELNGRPILSESYVFDSIKFALSDATGESYDPPLPILTYPLRDNDVRHWTGTVKFGSSSEPATADLTAKKETLNLAGGHYDTIAVEAKVNYMGGTNTKTVRSLKFWFAPHKGLIKRDFGLSSTREPMPLTPAPTGS